MVKKRNKILNNKREIIGNKKIWWITAGLIIITKK